MCCLLKPLGHFSAVAGKSLCQAVETLKLDELLSQASIHAHPIRCFCAHVYRFHHIIDPLIPLLSGSVVTPTNDAQRPVEDEDCRSLVIILMLDGDLG